MNRGSGSGSRPAPWGGGGGGRALRSTRNQEVDFSLVVPGTTALKHLGWFLEGTSNGVKNPLLLVQFLAAQGGRALLPFAQFTVACTLPLLLSEALRQQLAPLLDPRTALFATLLLVAVPLAFIWQDRLFTMTFESSHGVKGGGSWGFSTYLVHKWPTVQTDCLMLLAPVVAAGLLRAVSPEGEVVASLLDCLVLSYLAHNSRLDRMNVNTRGQKALFIDSRLPYFVGYSMPAAMLTLWLTKRVPGSALPFLLPLLVAALTAASSCVRPDEMGKPHMSSRILCMPHHLLSLALPSVSGRGVS